MQFCISCPQILHLILTLSMHAHEGYITHFAISLTYQLFSTTIKCGTIIINCSWKVQLLCFHLIIYWQSCIHPNNFWSSFSGLVAEELPHVSAGSGRHDYNNAWFYWIDSVRADRGLDED